MLQLRVWARRILCFTRTDTDKTHELCSRPTSTPPGPCTPEQDLHTLDQQNTGFQAPQHPHHHHIDGPQQLASLMPPKRKNQDTSANMDRPDKKTKTSRRGKKTASAAEDGESFHFLLQILLPLDLIWWRGRESLVVR